ncbi:MAG: nuclear transport factor 2 family protein [Pseudomonadota bacterium]|nr:nuclear transport factor 2 family protein [Pseudomonadota bacterium]
MTETPSTTTRELLDRRQIRDCIDRYSRGLDRHDDALLASAFHPDAIDNHGDWIGRLPEFIEWANYEVHEPLLQHNHHITTHTAEIDGDVAVAESYVIYVLRLKDRKTVRVGCGRYVDRLERRNGEWRIALRQLILDLRFTADGAAGNVEDGYYHGTWDRTDISYDRPKGIPADLAAKMEQA